MTPTLIFVRTTDIGDKRFTHGAELPPDLLPRKVIDQWLDSGRLKEYPDRRSLHRLFACFSGCKEKEQLDKAELDAYCLPK